MGRILHEQQADRLRHQC